VPKQRPFDVTVRAEKLSFVKDGPGTRKRIFVALANLSDNSLTIKEASNADLKVECKFKVTPP
jgi:hypothetical protein